MSINNEMFSEGTVEHSETLGSLALALAKAQGEFPAIPKTKTGKIQLKAGGEYSYKYADLADVLSAVQPSLTKYELAVIASPVVEDDGSGAIITQIIHSSGEWVRGRMRLLIVQPTPQGQGSAITYARRYSVSAMLNIASEADDDGAAANDHAGGNQSPRPTPAKMQVTDDIQLILDAADKTTDTFLLSLAEQFRERGTLTNNQITKGAEKARRFITVPRSAPAAEVPWPDEEPF